MDAALLDTSPPLVAASLSGHCWRLRAAEAGPAEALAREHDIPELLARVVLGRGVAPDAVTEFLHPSLKGQLPDPSHLLDMDVAAERVAGAVIGNETIAIFGDYDVDGATSSALLARFLRQLGREPIVYIPDRILEGYGPNTKALLELKKRGASVVITVDCGTLAQEPLAAAHEAGLDVIVVDHHTGGAQRPKAYALINPNRIDETTKLRNLAAVGVAFLLAVATQRSLRTAGYFAAHPEPDLIGLLDLAALGTVCDVVALTGLNRALVAQGLKIMAMRGNVGLRALMDVSRLDEPPGTYHAGFILGPRVNAGGRVGKADYGARLLSTQDEAEAVTLAKALDQYNEERKAIEAMVLEEAMAMATAQDAADEPLLLVASKDWHPGVIGIVAGRLKERFGKPAAVVALDGATGKASARSVTGFDFGAAVIAARDLGLLLGGGGHAMAAGFTLEAAQVPALHAFLCKRLNTYVRHARGPRTLHADGCIALSGITSGLAQMLELAAPFGQGNPHPRVVAEHVTLAHMELVGKTQDHLRLHLADEGRTRLTAMAFRAGGTPLGKALLGCRGKRVHVLGQVRRKFWQGREQVEFTVEDVAAA